MPGTRFVRRFLKPYAAAAFMTVLAACGGGGGTRSPPAPELALFAGNLGGPGTADGSGANARFIAPNGIATDSQGNVYVADTHGQTIRKISSDGIVSTVAGRGAMSGSADGLGVEARFLLPGGVAADSAGNIYVADTSNHTIRKIAASGLVSTVAGEAGVWGSADGPGAQARFWSPSGVATDQLGNIYVADWGNHTIRKITSTGVVSTLAGSAASSGSRDGLGADARFYFPAGVATDKEGNVYVAGAGNSAIRKISPAGMVSTLAGLAGSPGSADGTAANARFDWPTGVAVDRVGNVYVADRNNHTIRKIAATGVVSTLAGTAGSYGSADGVGSQARFDHPAGVAVDGVGRVYVVDEYNSTIRSIDPEGTVTTLAGAVRLSGAVDGIGADARFNGPEDVAADSSGNLYVADFLSHTIRKIDPTGRVTTMAGAAGSPGSADGVGAQARFNHPEGVATDRLGNVYVADHWNTAIRKITPSGIVTTLAGASGSPGSADGIGAEARFWQPRGVAADGFGNVYVADTGNSTVRKITREGVVSTLAGLAGSPGSADGTGAQARFNAPHRVAADGAGNVYVADTGNSTVRKITPEGVVSTLAGLAESPGSADGIGAQARFNAPRGVAVDSAGSLYVADSANDTIRKIGSAGVVTTIAGVAGVLGFTPGSLPGVLAWPTGITVSGTSLYFTSYDGVAVVTNVP
jgi:sugar lactone lactonase YvrE